MTLTSTTLGVGWSVERQSCRLRNGTGADIAEGDVLHLDVDGTGAGTVLTAAQGNKFHRFSTVTDITTADNRALTPAFVAAQPVLAGRMGNFWLSHPEILIAADSNVSVDGLALSPDAVNGANVVLALISAADSDVFARVCGFSLEGAGNTRAGMVLGCFDGIHFGGVGG